VQQVIDYSVYLAIRVVLCVVQALPLDLCERGASTLATLFGPVLGIRRRVIDENLQRAFPQTSAAARRRLAWQMWQHLFLMVAEIAHTQRMICNENWRRRVRLVNIAPMIETLLHRRPSLVVTAHYGNFELAGYMLGLFGFPTVTVARPLDNRFLDRFVNEFRGATGQYIVPKQDSAGLLADYLDAGAHLTLLGDQAAGPKGCWVDFFGQPASTHKAIAVFALGNESPLLVSLSRRIGGPLNYEIGLAALADPRDSDDQFSTVPELTQWFTAELEEVIRRGPEQYWWVHRRWKGEPKRRRRKQRAAA